MPDTLFEGAGDRLPNAPHGLNRYSQINNAAFLSSLNPTTDHFRFLRTQGISGEDLVEQFRRIILVDHVPVTRQNGGRIHGGRRKCKCGRSKGFVASPAILPGLYGKSERGAALSARSETTSFWPGLKEVVRRTIWLTLGRE